MKRRLICVLLAVCMVIAIMPANAFALSPSGNIARYFYSQLRPTAKVFYDAMVKMEADGSFKTGNASVELTSSVGQDVLAGQVNGSVDLLSEFGAARDAYIMDNPSVFYVDFSALSIRITGDQSGYHLYMGPGKYDNYYTAGFTSETQVNAAIAIYNTALDQLVAKASGLTDPAAIVTVIHDEIAKSVTYRDELTLFEMQKSDSIGTIRTAYGALINHEGVCESYTRAFKAAMDRLGIPCVMIMGVYTHGENDYEQHIWDAVEIDGEWYGVDVTMDDPINKKTQTTNTTGLDGYENHEYLLVGEAKLSVHHKVSNVMSESNFAFGYPIMNMENEAAEGFSDPNAPLQVMFDVTQFEGTDAGTYYVSYLGMNDLEMKQQGYYLLMKTKIWDTASRSWEPSEWFYVDTTLYEAIGHEVYNGLSCTVFPMPHIEYIEFGVTDIQPSTTVVAGVTIPDFYFHGDPMILLADSGMQKNKYGSYRAAPYALKVTPYTNMAMMIDGTTHHVTAEFDDILVTQEVYDKYCDPSLGSSLPPEDEYLKAIQTATVQDISLSVKVTDRGVGSQSGTREGDYSYLTSGLKMYHTVPTDGSKPYTTVEFDFTPSEMWADDNVYYDFYIDGVVGAWSGKAANSFGFGCSHPCAICCYRKQGFDYNCFAKPQILTDGDLSVGDIIENAEGTPFEKQLKSRLMLVVSDANKKDEHTMTDLIDQKTSDTVLSSSSYNINLTLCRKQLSELKDGMSIRVTCGFPVGYGPEDAGVEFKAYHYIKDADGNITDIETIPCTVTPYGLLIEVRSFSPFTIAAVAADPAKIDTAKSVVLVANEGGSITVNGQKASTVSLKPGESLTYTVTPDAGYKVDTVEISGAAASAQGNTYTIKYEDITDAHSAVVNAKFIAIAATVNEVGEAVVQKAAAPAQFDITTSSSTVGEGGSFTLSVLNPNPAYTYRWYRESVLRTIDNAHMIGTGENLTVTGAHSSHSGTYYCKAVAIAGASMAETVSAKALAINVISGPVSQHTHEFKSAVSDGETGHHLVCDYIYPDGTRCGAASEITHHTFTDGKCTVCGFVSSSSVNPDPPEPGHTHEYTYFADGEAGHYGVCQHIDGNTVCGERTATVAHSFVNGVCTVCGYEEKVTPGHTHAYTYYASGDVGHYGVCACGEKTAITAHSFVNGVCSVCGYKITQSNPLPTNPGHVHSTVTSHDDENHYLFCPGCGTVTFTQPHSFDQNGKCTYCGYVRADLAGDPVEVDTPQEGKRCAECDEVVG